MKPLAGLLGVAADDAVFLDIASIEPGDRWKDQIDGALRDSTVFIVCWCCEAEKSEFVAYEISVALKGTEKKLVPVLFCDTPLPKSLSVFQWIDLRGQVKHVCGNAAAAAPIRQPLAPPSAVKGDFSKWLLISGIAFSAMLLLSAIGLTYMHSKPRAPVASRSDRKAPAVTTVQPPPVSPDDSIKTGPARPHLPADQYSVLPLKPGGVESPTPDSRFPQPESNPAARELEIRNRLSMVKEGETVYDSQSPRSSVKPLIEAAIALLAIFLLTWTCWKLVHRNRAQKIVDAATAYFRQLGNQGGPP